MKYKFLKKVVFILPLLLCMLFQHNAYAMYPTGQFDKFLTPEQKKIKNDIITAAGVGAGVGLCTGGPAGAGIGAATGAGGAILKAGIEEYRKNNNDDCIIV